jgi:TetR/AcrR family transcriptional regulator, transcriptional repressor for nem operon
MSFYGVIMRYDAEHKERTRQRLLTEAAAALRSEGPERVGVAALMGKLGLTHGGFYAHFNSKDDLVAAAIDEMFAQTQAVLKKKTEGRPPAEALERYIDFYLSARHCEAVGQGCALPSLAADVSRMDRTARRRFAAGTRHLHEGIAALFRALGHNEEEAMECATSLFSEMSGAIALARAVDTPKEAEQIRNRSRSAIKKRLGLLPAA